MERRSRVMGVGERIFQARLEQPRALAPHQRNDHALAQTFQVAVDCLLDDPEIHDNDCVFIRFHAPRRDSGFTQGLPVCRWRQEPDGYSISRPFSPTTEFRGSSLVNPLN